MTQLVKQRMALGVEMADRSKDSLQVIDDLRRLKEKAGWGIVEIKVYL